MILTFPGRLLRIVKVSSISIGSSSSSELQSDTISSVSHSSRSHGGEPVEDLKTPEAPACGSVGIVRAVDGFCFRELRAMRICDGFVVITRLQQVHS